MPAPPFAGRGRRRVVHAARGPPAGVPRPRQRLASAHEMPRALSLPGLSLAGPARPMWMRPKRLPPSCAAAILSFEFFGASDAPVLRSTHGRSASGDQQVASCPTVPHAAARTQARTGFREGKNPPRRSGEGQPLRAFGSGRRMRTAGFVEGSTGRHRRQCAGQCRRQSQHRAAEAMAVSAVQIHGARRLVALNIRGRIRNRPRIDNPIGNRFGTTAGSSVVLVVVVTQVPGGGLGLVSAIRGHRRPAELERQQSEQDDGEKAAHGRESSGYRVGPGTTRVARLWGITTSKRGRVRRCGSSHGE
jgi:hypothetical protein